MVASDLISEKCSRCTDSYIIKNDFNIYCYLGGMKYSVDFLYTGLLCVAESDCAFIVSKT